MKTVIDAVNELNTFTQKMVDEGVLPSVGMECEFETTFFTLESSNTGICKPIAFYGGKVWLESGNSEFVINLNVITFKPLTPPIELEDGERYEFMYEGIRRLAFYNSRTKEFDMGMSHWLYMNCTNIQLLEVAK